MAKQLIIIASIFLCTSLSVSSQVADSVWIKKTYSRISVYDESQADSLLYYADLFDKEKTKSNYSRLPVIICRLRGLYYNMKSDYSKAIEQFIQGLHEADKIHDLSEEMLVYSDLASLYGNINQFGISKKYSFLSIEKAELLKDSMMLSTELNNLGVTYSMLGQQDSALSMYQKALSIAKASGDDGMIFYLNNNIGDVYLSREQWEKALGYFRSNLQKDAGSNRYSNLYTDNFNMAEVFIGLKDFDSARQYLQKTDTLSDMLQSKKLLADNYGLWSKYYRQKGEFKNALEFFQKRYDIDTSIVNESTNGAVMELQEKYNANKREAQIQLQASEIDKQKLRNRNVSILAIAFVLITLIIAISLYQNYRKNKRLEEQNDLISRQNTKLSELNHEKNSLISMLSHDLSTPFATIRLWANLLHTDMESLNEEQVKAVNRILKSSEDGEEMIRNILDVEREDFGKHKLHLENIDLRLFTENMAETFKPAAEKKEIGLHVETPDHSVYFLTDKQLVSRIFDNLLSNAIKYSPKGKNVWVSVSDEKDAISIKVRDEGVGINNEELPLLFSKYSKLSSRPTDGEPSTGLGLSIVKRIVEELNGKISCESEPGKGTLFTVVMKK